MGTRSKGDLEKYLRQQIDLGFEEIYLPFESRAGAPETAPRESLPNVKEPAALTLERFSEATTLAQLEKTISHCNRCPLWNTRTNLVFGDGNPHAEIMFIGEAPGRDEDLQGIPFVGRAGKLLNKMLVDVGLKREDVYIANILKSRPPENRDPEPDEVEACEPYLHMQIKLIKPRLICSLGRIAAQTLLKTKKSLGEMRGKWYDYRGAKFMVTYHPAAILRTMGNYEAGIEDLKRLLKELGK
jgi:DNA polymerase